MQTRPVWLPEVRDLMALMVIGAMIGMLYILLLRPVAVPDNQMTNILIGGFMTATTAVIQFYFGSSKQSSAKDDTISALAGPAPAVTTTTTTAPAIELPRQMPAPPRPMPAPVQGAPRQ